MSKRWAILASNIPNFEVLSALAKQHQIPLIVDNTLVPVVLCCDPSSMAPTWWSKVPPSGSVVMAPVWVG